MDIMRVGARMVLAAFMACSLVPAGYAEVSGQGCKAGAPVQAVEEGNGIAQAGNGGKEAEARPNPFRAEKGDLCMVQVTSMIEGSGEWVLTTDSEDGKKESIPKSQVFTDIGPGPASVVAGEHGIYDVLAQALIGMAPGDSGILRMKPEEQYGKHDDAMVKTFDRIKNMPKKVEMTPYAFFGKEESFPQVGKVIDLNPYFNGRIVEITANKAFLEAVPSGELRRVEEYGVTTIEEKENDYIISLDPVIGADFKLSNRVGKITSKDEKQFTVDFNHPLAGKTIKIEFQVVELRKKSELEGSEISWIKGFNEGRSARMENNKPGVFVLYAEWCGWSKRLLKETMTDIRVRRLAQDFVWTKVDCDKEKQVATEFGVEHYPVILIIGKDGELANKITGFVKADVLEKQLMMALQKDAADKQGQAKTGQGTAGEQKEPKG